MVDNDIVIKSRPDAGSSHLLDTTAILKQFDTLHSTNELFYSPSAPSRSTYDGLDFEFRTVPSFSLKPHLSISPSTNQSSSTPATATPPHRRPPADGSDIDHSDPAFFVAWVSDTTKSISTVQTEGDEGEEGRYTHKLILNKFCVARPQYLLLTTDPTRKQTEALVEGDLRAAWAVLGALQDGASSGTSEGGMNGGAMKNGEERKEGLEHYVIFNGGRDAGSSRTHLHLQVLGMPGGTGDGYDRGAKGKSERELLWPGTKIKSLEGQEHDERLDLPYQALATQLHSQRADVVDYLVTAYRRHYLQCQHALGKQEGQAVPHNIILTRDYLITIPRRAATVEGIAGHSVGAQGMLGLVWCNNESQVEGWRDSRPIDVLKGLGVPCSWTGSGI